MCSSPNTVNAFVPLLEFSPSFASEATTILSLGFKISMYFSYYIPMYFKIIYTIVFSCVTYDSNEIMLIILFCNLFILLYNIYEIHPIKLVYNVFVHLLSQRDSLPLCCYVRYIYLFSS